jgi:hypothetical protein
MDFIKYIDFFKLKFYFYTNNQANYQNIFGGFMAVFYILSCLAIFIGFSLDDIKRLNPITTQNEIRDSEKKIINMNEEKLWIPFRIVNYENQFVDHRGSLHVVPYLIEGNFDEEIGMDLKAHLLNYKFCNETSMAHMPSNYKIDIPLNQLFCLEREIIPFGGFWNDNHLCYIEVNLFLCEEGIPYNASDPRCQKLDRFLEKVNSSLLIDFYFPIVQFQPTNLNTPIEIIYKNYYYRLTSHSYKIHKLFLREHILSDDRNLIVSHYKNYSSWGMSALYADDYFLPTDYDAISNNSNTSRIYALNIYMDDGFFYYTRTYKKILLIISNVFPLFKIAFFFIKKATVYSKMALTKQRLTGLIFENDEILPRRIKKLEDLKIDVNQKDKKAMIKSNKSENDLIREITNINNETNELSDFNFLKKITHIKYNLNKKKDEDNKKDIYINNYINNNLNNNINNIINNNNIIYNNKCDDNKNKNITNNSNVACINPSPKNNNVDINNYIYGSNILSNKLNKSLNNDKPINNNNNKISQKEMSLGNSKKKNSSIYDPLETKDSFNKSEKSKYIFPYIFYLVDFLYNNSINPKRYFCISKKYFLVYRFMCNLYDISTHLILFKQFNLLYSLISSKMCEEKDNNFFEIYLTNKINIGDNRVIEKLTNSLHNKKSILYSNFFL